MFFHQFQRIQQTATVLPRLPLQVTSLSSVQLAALLQSQLQTQHLMQSLLMFLRHLLTNLKVQKTLKNHLTTLSFGKLKLTGESYLTETVTMNPGKLKLKNGDLWNSRQLQTLLNTTWMQRTLSSLQKWVFIQKKKWKHTTTSNSKSTASFLTLK